MKLVAQIKLLPTPDQANALLGTLRAANAACNDISGVAWHQQTFGKFDLQKLTYDRIETQYGLGAQMVIRCLAKVGDSYKLDRKTQRHYKPHGSIAFDDRILSFNPNKVLLSIWTTEGRQSMPFVAGERQNRLLATRQGESDLVYRKGKFFLLVTCDVDEPAPEDGEGALGVDLGIVNLATDSDGTVYSGAQVETTRQWYRKRRSALQSVGTKSAKRRLKQLSGRQRRFQADTNHCISKRIVGCAKGTARGIVLEDLKGMRERRTVGHTQRAWHSNWAFGQLRRFITYKAGLAGTHVTLVDPRNTSRRCNECGYCDAANRHSQARFCCVSCRYTCNADLNAAKNIRDWAAVMQPMVSDLQLLRPVPVQGQAALL